MVFGIVLLIMVFAQATIVPSINPLAISPDFVLLLLFMVSATRGTREGMGWLLLCGFITDIIAMDALGSNGLALLPAVILAGPARGRVFQSNIVIPIILVAVVTLLHGVVITSLRGIMIDITVPLQALMHAVLMPFVYFALRWLD
jgi:rod shape-determining protein MreD